MRGNLAAVRRAGLGPGIPPRFFDRLAMICSLWGFEAADRARALAAGDAKTLMRMLRRSRRFGQETGAGLARLERVLLSQPSL